VLHTDLSARTPGLGALENPGLRGLGTAGVAASQVISISPLSRLIHLELQGSDPEQLFKAAAWMSEHLRAQLGDRILGPQVPNVSRVKNLFRQQILVKVDKQQDSPSKIKHFLSKMAEEMIKNKVYKGLRVVFDVDPH